MELEVRLLIAESVSVFRPVLHPGAFGFGFVIDSC